MGRRVFIQAALGTTVAGIGPAFQGNAPRQEASTKKSYRETLETPIVARHQVVVAGGAPSGVIAALAAIRSGVDTLLVERYAFLGSYEGRAAPKTRREGTSEAVREPER